MNYLIPDTNNHNSYYKPTKSRFRPLHSYSASFMLSNPLFPIKKKPQTWVGTSLSQLVSKSRSRPVVYKYKPRLAHFWVQKKVKSYTSLSTLLRVTWLSKYRRWSHGTRLVKNRTRFIRRYLSANLKFRQIGSYKYSSKVYFTILYPQGLSQLPPQQPLSGKTIQSSPNPPKWAATKILTWIQRNNEVIGLRKLPKKPNFSNNRSSNISFINSCAFIATVTSQLLYLQNQSLVSANSLNLSSRSLFKNRLRTLLTRARAFRLLKFRQTLGVRLRLKFQWKALTFSGVRVRKGRRKTLRRKILMLRLLKFTWKFNRTRTYKTSFHSSVYKQPSFRIKAFLKLFKFRLDAVLVQRFRVRSLRYARVLILLGHVSINGIPSKKVNRQIEKFDVIGFTFKSLKWLKILRLRRKKSIKNKARRSRKFFNGLLYGPGRRWGVIWSPLKFHKSTGSKLRRRAKFYIPNKSHIRFLLASIGS